MRRGTSAALSLTAFALSGAAGLVYELVWTRAFARTLGVTTAANASVLAVYLGGLGLGAWIAGAKVDRLRAARAAIVYAALESLVAAFALLSPTLIRALYSALESLTLAPDSWARALARPALCAVILAAPTMAMGATLPALLRATRGAFASERAQLSGLYASNTGGAMVGALAAGHVLVPRYGNNASIQLGALASIAAAAMALVASRLVSRADAANDESAPSHEHRELDARPGLTAALAFVCGAMILGGEVLWTRTLVTALGATIFALSSVLAWVLAGLTVGATIARWIAARSEALAVRRALALTVGATAGASLLSLHLAPVMAQWSLRWGEAHTFSSTLLPFAVTAPIALVPALFSGAAMPLAIRSLTDRSNARAAAMVYGANTLGCVLGSLVVGLVAIPAAGTHRSALALALLGAVVAVAALWAERERGARVAAAVTALAIALLALTAPRPDIRVWAGGTHMLPQRVRRLIAQDGFAARSSLGRMLYASEGAESSIVVERIRGHRTFFVGGKPEASDDPEDMRNQYLLGHLPALLHGHPTSGLVVGMGSGMTAGTLSLHTPVDLVDLSPPVRNAARLFSDLNHHAADNPRITIHHEDGRAFLLSAKRSWDVITVDPIHPYVAGAATLYTRDYFALVRSRLARGGVAAHWLPLYQLRWEDVCGVLRSFSDVFTDATVYLTGGDAILIGGAGDAIGDPARFREGFLNTSVREDLVRVWLDTPERLAATACCSGPALRRMVQWARPITDDQTWIEFTAPSTAQQYTPDNVRWLSELGAALVVRDPRAARARATYHFVLRAQLDRWSTSHDTQTPLADFEAALARDPESVELRAHVVQRRGATR